MLHNFFFLELIAKEELEIFKIHGTTNLKIINIIFITSFLAGVLLTTFYYSFSSKLKFLYLDLKNTHSNDNKYLAVVNENGLWIKDELDNKIFIINAIQIDNNILKEVTINEFNKQFKLTRIVLSEQVDISSKKWIVFNPRITIDNDTKNLEENVYITTHYNYINMNL